MSRWWNDTRLLPCERGHARAQTFRTLGKRNVRKIYISHTYMQRIVQSFLNHHHVPFEYSCFLRRGELKPFVFEPYREVIIHDSFRLHGQDGRQSCAYLIGEKSVRVTLRSWDHFESSVVLGQVCIAQKHIRRITLAYPREPQLFHEPILQCPKEPFNPSFGLRRVGVDDLDTKLCHRSLELRHHRWVVDRVLVIDLVCAESVEVYGDRKPVRLEIRPPEAEYGIHTLIVFKHRRDAVVRIINRRQETL